MTSGAGNRLRLTVITLASALAVAASPLLSADFKPGYHPAAYAIQGARIVAGPDTVYEPGTVVVRDGRIESVGAAGKVAVPFDAETIDGKGLIVYPGFIDLYTTIGQTPGVTRSQTGAGRAVDFNEDALAQTPTDNRNGLTPEFEVATALDLSESIAEERRKLGFTDVLSAPAGAIATGQSALISTSGHPRREAIVRSPVALHVNLRTPFEPSPPRHSDDDQAAPRMRTRVTGRYPSVLMGAVAHLRQAMLDADYQHALRDEEKLEATVRAPFDPALQALYAAKTKQVPVWWEANTRDEIHRVLDLAQEFGTSAVIVGGREAARVADRLKALDVPVVLRLDFPDQAKLPTEAEYQKRELADRGDPYALLLERESRWKERVGTAAALAKAGVRFAFSSDGIAKTEQFPAQFRKLLAAGLTRDAALDGLTRRAAQIAGLDKMLGTIEPGKLGHVVAVTEPLGEENSRVRYVLVDGLKFEILKSNSSRKSDGEGKSRKDEPKAEPARAKGEAVPAKAETAKAKGETTRATEPDAAKAKVQTPSTPAAPPRTIEDPAPRPPWVDAATEFDLTRKPKIQTGGDVLIKGATVLTAVKDGTIPKGSILIRKGKIAAVGTDVDAPKDVTVIDGTGMVAMPGIIDTHSHIAIQGSGNEWSLSVVPEVRIKDVITGDDPAIYRALAGGTTTARILHGSADAIGGQDAVIKLKYGMAGRDLILRDAPQGVKFALGENVTRNPGRFPNTRMGVEATLERAFEEAKAYAALWEAYESAKADGQSPTLPRRDLRLEALAAILDGSFRIHCHCYRSDEILMLLRVAARHGVRVRSLQHVLEGYKVAPEIASHGASASTFSDWWAYKIEAFDAIPYNAALLTQAGVSVCIKSDSEELIRHLNLEAAKMVKYGGVTESQALAMITMNPARELGLQDRIGSIEVGKDGDIALFNGHPFDGFARCEMVLIDGEVRFQRAEKERTPASAAVARTAMPAAENGSKLRVLEVPSNPKGLYALVGATLHPITGKDIARGTLVIREGKIEALGGPDTRVPESAQSVDVSGFDIWPGLVDGGTRLGLYEVNSLAETQDDADSGRFQPELRASSALHPDSEIIPVARANGILTAYVQPGGELISGQGCAIQLDGWVPREMVLADPVALHVTIPRHVPDDPATPPLRGDGPDPHKKRREQIDAIKEEFRRATAYDRVRTEAQAQKLAAPAPDPRLAALVPYAKGEKPVIFHADHREEILDALKIADELKVRAILSGGLDAWKVAEAIKAAKVPVLVGGTLQLPIETSDPYDAPYRNPARLYEAGVTFALRSYGQGPQQATASRNLPYEAAMAVAFGLPEAEALKAITIGPARILGIDGLVGSLETGKHANLVITAGHILQPTTEVKGLFLSGRPIEPKSRHTRLYEKYRQRLAEVQAGTALLGIETKPVPTPEPIPPMIPPAAPAAPAGNH